MMQIFLSVFFLVFFYFRGWGVYIGHSIRIINIIKSTNSKDLKGRETIFSFF